MRKLMSGTAAISVASFIALMPMSAGAATLDTMDTSGSLATEFASTGFSTVPSSLDGGTSNVNSGLQVPFVLDQYNGALPLLEAILTIAVQWSSNVSAENNNVDFGDTITLRVDIDALVENPTGGLLSVQDFAGAGASVTSSDNAGVPNGRGFDFFSATVGGSTSTAFSFFDADLSPFIGGGTITLQFAADTLNSLSSSNANTSSSFATTAEISVNVEYITAAVVPLPASALLMLSGFAGLGYMARRRRLV